MAIGAKFMPLGTNQSVANGGYSTSLTSSALTPAGSDVGMTHSAIDAQSITIDYGMIKLRWNGFYWVQIS